MHFDGTIWRPPYEAGSLLLQATAGCTHHRCKFCTLYEDLPFRFRMSPLAEVQADLDEAARYSLAVGRVFLTGANPFVLTAGKLGTLAREIHQRFPAVQSIGCFARVTDVTRKTPEDLAQLRELGYDGLTLGVETGDDAALAFMRKGYTAADVLEQCQKLDAAGISYHFFYLTGISGAGRGEAGARASARLFNQLHPRTIGASMLTIFETSELYQEIQLGSWREAGEIEKLAELKALIEHLTIPTRIATDGASNLVQVRGELPRDRARLAEGLGRLMAAVDEDVLRSYRTNLRHL